MNLLPNDQTCTSQCASGIKRYSLPFAAMLGLSLSNPAHSIISLGEAADNFKTSLVQVGLLLLILAAVIGIFKLITGSLGVVKARKQGEETSEHTGNITMGAMLFAIPAAISLVSLTFFGSDATSFVADQFGF